MTAADGQSELSDGQPDPVSLDASISGTGPDDTGAKGGSSSAKKLFLKRVQYRQRQLYDTLLPEPPLQLAQHRWVSDARDAKRTAFVGADASDGRSEREEETSGGSQAAGNDISDAFRAAYRSRPFRPIERAAQKARIQALRYLLVPQVGKSHGLHVREDGWVSLRELLRHPQLNSMDIVEFHRLLESDFGGYIDIVYDPRKLSNNDAGPSVAQPIDGWWVRLLDVKDDQATPPQPLRRLSQRAGGPKRAFYHVNGSRHLVYQLKKKGIPCHEMVKLTTERRTPPYLSRPFEDSTDIFISIDIERAEREHRTPFFVDPSNPTELWTPGDDCGFLRPQAFDKVETIAVSWELLWADGLNLGPRRPNGQQDNALAEGEGATTTTEQQADPHPPPLSLDRSIPSALQRSLGKELSRLRSSGSFLEEWLRDRSVHEEHISPNLRTILDALPLASPRRKRIRTIPEPPEGIAPFWDFGRADSHL